MSATARPGISSSRCTTQLSRPYGDSCSCSTSVDRRGRETTPDGLHLAGREGLEPMLSRIPVRPHQALVGMAVRSNQQVAYLVGDYMTEPTHNRGVLRQCDLRDAVVPKHALIVQMGQSRSCMESRCDDADPTGFPQAALSSNHNLYILEPRADALTARETVASCASQ
jgi:hypothetical protein